MDTIDRRRALLLSLAAPLSTALIATTGEGHDMSMAPPSWTRPDEVAMLLYPKMTALDLIGPQYMFASLMGAKVHLVSKTREPVTSDTGVVMIPTATFADCPSDLTVLFAPGGTAGTVSAMQDEDTLAFLADRGSRAKYVTSVCTGSLILGAAGLLRGYRATSHWCAREVLSEFGAIPTAERVVRDRNRITGAGVTAGLDFGLAMVAELRDAQYAQDVQLICEYDPHPPFTSGSLETAPAGVKSTISAMFNPLVVQFRQAAQSIRQR